MKYCPFYSRTWKCCCVKSFNKALCNGGVDASCKRYQSGMQNKIGQERRYRESITKRSYRPLS